MAIRIPLQAIPNQSLSVQLDGQRYDIRLNEANGIMAATISINETVVISGARIVDSGALLNYQYLEGDGGNFVFLTELDEIPYYTMFGDTQQLIYLTAAEIANLNG